jgi:hypothetical protein
MTHHKKSAGYTEALRCLLLLPALTGSGIRNMFPDPFYQTRAAVNFC